MSDIGEQMSASIALTSLPTRLMSEIGEQRSASIDQSADKSYERNWGAKEGCTTEFQLVSNSEGRYKARGLYVVLYGD